MARAIETAPKHGGWILLWAEGMKPQPFYWSDLRGEWVQSDDANPVRWTAYEDGTCGPEFWAPLPTVADFTAIQTLSDASDEINGEIDKQIYDECLRMEDVPPDYEFHVVIEHKQLVALNSAICGVQSMLPRLDQVRTAPVESAGLPPEQTPNTNHPTNPSLGKE